MKIQQVAIVGTPDFVGCVSGWGVVLELKATLADKLEPLQLYNLRQMEKSGGIALAACPENWHVIYDYLKELSAKGIGHAHSDVWATARRDVCQSYDENGKLQRLQEPKADVQHCKNKQAHARRGKAS